MKYIAILLLLFSPVVVIADDSGTLNAPVVLSTEQYVRDYFKDAPDLVRIAGCESTFRQFNKDGTVLRGKVNKYDIGVTQINVQYWGKKAQDLGYDIYTLDGNLRMARWIYEHQGSAPWFNSQKCWS